VLFHESKQDPEAEGLQKRIRDAELLKAEEEAAIRSLDRQRKQREEAESERSLVRVDVVSSLLAEALGELRRLIDDVPFVVSRQVPAEVLPYVYVDETHVKELSRLSPLQRALLKVTEGYQRWLDRIPEDVFQLDEES
jgi:hypothetical protein